MPSGLGQAYEVVAEHFPNQRLAIWRLIKVNDEFRELCVDLLEAEAALTRCSKLGSQSEEDRIRDWKKVIELLDADLSSALKAFETGLPQENWPPKRPTH